MILTGNDCDHFDQILNSLHFPRFPLWLLAFHLFLFFFLIRVFCSLPFLALFLVLIDDRRLLSIKIKLGLNRCLSQGTKAVSQLLDAKIQHFGIISGYSGHGNFRSKSFGGMPCFFRICGFQQNSYYIVIEASALTFWIIAINQVTISIQVSLLFSCLLQQFLLPPRKLGL